MPSSIDREHATGEVSKQTSPGEGVPAQGVSAQGVSECRLPALLAILDGFGLAESGEGNAISRAHKPFLDELLSGDYPMRTLQASGRAVGLPDGQMGNSEVGHLNIGAGRVVDQELTRIDRACEDGSILENPVLIEAIDAAQASGGTVHFMGLISDGGVHSSIVHLEALLAMAAQRGARSIHIHGFMDGRDVPPTSGITFVERISSYAQALARQTGAAIGIATLQGRFYAMDRDNRWERVAKAWHNLVQPHESGVDPVKAMQDSYDAGVTDEFMLPIAFTGRGVQDGDTVIFFNFRPDRAREISRVFTEPAFSEFDRVLWPQVDYVCLTEYDASLDAPIAFPKYFPRNVLADYLSSLGLRQLHIAETEKYAHVTFFLNGGVEKAKQGEERILIPSPKVATYDLKPEMSAPEVTDALVDAIEHDQADVYIVNYANCDMVGHTGSIPAAITAVEAVDAGLHRVIEAIQARGGYALVTADHGNADKMLDEEGSPFTAHTTNPVPLVLLAPPGCAQGYGLIKGGNACLADIAPTLIDLMGLIQPSEWTGKSLLTHAEG